MFKKQNKEIKVFNFIKDFIEKNKFSPSIREINEHFNWHSSSSAYYHLLKLAIDGKIIWEQNKARTIRLV